MIGLTKPIRDLTGGPGFLFEAGIMAVEGHFICDGLLGEVVALGYGYQSEYNQTFQELKAIGAFHKVPKPGFLRPALILTPAGFQAMKAAMVAPQAHWLHAISS